MGDFSIEMTAERIVDSRTRRYFEEVRGAYSAGHYRSAVVMLWSVVVCDVLFKLDQLANAHGDATAKSILAEIDEARKKNPKSPEWESELIAKVAGRTDLLDAGEFTHLQNLQNHRHLSAHPVLTAADALFAPNRETARAHIRNALEAVLTKPAIMSKKVFDTFIEDVEEVSRLSPGREGMEKYLQSKYFAHFSTATHTAIFKSVWRLVFKSSDARCEANRTVNLLALAILFDRQPPEILRAIEDDRAWFSDVSFGESHVECLTSFFREHPQVFELLTDAVKAPIRDYANGTLDRFALCWFLSDSPRVHVDEVCRRVGEEDGSMSGGVFEGFCRSLKDTDAYTSALSVGILLYGRSPDFDTADVRFDRMVRPFTDDYSLDHVKDFLAACEGNSQTWSRKRAYADHREIVALIESRFSGEIDLTAFPDFGRSIRA